jgi:hypothetical protein
VQFDRDGVATLMKHSEVLTCHPPEQPDSNMTIAHSITAVFAWLFKASF